VVRHSPRQQSRLQLLHNEAGPYKGDGSVESIEANIREAEKYQTALANKEIGFFCAHNHTGHFPLKGTTAPESFYYNLDFQFLMRTADAVLAILNWEKYWGAKREIHWAKQNKMKIFYPRDPADIGEIASWAK